MDMNIRDVAIGSKLIHEAIKKAGITMVATLPEQKVADLISLVDADPALRHVSLCREEEGIAICAGTYLAGGKPAMIIQNGGLLNSVNGLTSTAIHSPRVRVKSSCGMSRSNSRISSTSSAPVSATSPTLGMRASIGMACTWV